jgi:hypothetical protein
VEHRLGGDLRKVCGIEERRDGSGSRRGGMDGSEVGGAGSGRSADRIRVGLLAMGCSRRSIEVVWTSKNCFGGSIRGRLVLSSDWLNTVTHILAR